MGGGGGGNKRLTFPGFKAASEVELQPICSFDSKKYWWEPGLWTPYFKVCATTVMSAFMVARTRNISRRLRVLCWLGLFFLFPRHMRCGRETGSSRTDSEIDGSVPGYFSWGEKPRRIF